MQHRGGNFDLESYPRPFYNFHAHLQLLAILKLALPRTPSLSCRKLLAKTSDSVT